MKIITFSDIHGTTSILPQIESDLARADLVMISGDITDFGREHEAQKVIQSIRRFNNRILAVSGNCDYPEVDRYLTMEKLNLQHHSTVINELLFIGVGGSLNTPFNTPNEKADDDFGLELEGALSDQDFSLPMVLLVHQPPYGTRIDLVRGQHLGSRVLRDFILKYQPLVCFSGHFHEAVGQDTLGNTLLVNPGPLRNGGYVWTEIIRRVENLAIKNIF
ncbi:metallophosphoesterase family protein [bacterium]|nr:metallophosphoesterase family protein [bacterium]